MKTSDMVSADKIRGGFYSPDALVKVCLDRALLLAADRHGLRVLEPSSGDGAFLRGLAEHPLGQRVEDLLAVELLDEEAEKSREALARSEIRGRVVTGSLLSAKPADLGTFDVAIGNPPFVRFQFVTAEDRLGSEKVASDLGLSLHGVSNLWIPVFLRALTRLKDGGIFTFIIPSECFTGTSARLVRTWLIENTSALQVDLFPPGSFPGVLQEVVILSGRLDRGGGGPAKIEIVDHGVEDSWLHVADTSMPTWTGLLLRPEHLNALEFATSASGVFPLRSVAKLSVATVTGANEYFSLTEERRQRYGLEGWSRPLLARIRHARGLDFSWQDFETNLAEGHPVWLLDTALGVEDPSASPSAVEYIEIGEEQGLPKRYKCRIRTPWHKVPVVRPGSLLLSKRSHMFPRLIRNSVAAVTTDTIYQGSPSAQFEGRETDIVTSFHNSLTLLTAEMYGRSFGGGVLELVPSEVSALQLPLAEVSADDAAHLDRLVRSMGADAEDLIHETNAIISRSHPALDRHCLEVLDDARRLLCGRRMLRTGKASIA